MTLRLDNTGKVDGAYELNFDSREFSALHIMDGWKTYRMEDVAAAADDAYRRKHLSAEHRLNLILDKLYGREITFADRPAEDQSMEPTLLKSG